MRRLTLIAAFIMFLFASAAEADRTFTCRNPPDAAASVAVRDGVWSKYSIETVGRADSTPESAKWRRS